jgi:hypothetical protein
MIYLGSVMFFRREKYRFVLLIVGFLAFHFSTIIAVVESDKVRGTYPGYRNSDRKSITILPLAFRAHERIYLINLLDQLDPVPLLFF